MTIDKLDFLAFLGVPDDVISTLRDKEKAGGPSSTTTVKAPQPGSGGSTGDDSSLAFTTTAFLYVNGSVRSQTSVSQSGAIEMDAGQSGQLMMMMKIHAFEDNLWRNDSFTQELQISWDVSADANGELSIEPPQEKWGAPTEGTYYRLDSTNPDKGKTFVQIAPVIVSGGDSGQVGIPGVGIGKQAAPAKIKETFRVDIRVKVPTTPDPKGTVTIGPEVTVYMKFEYMIGPFRVGSAKDLVSGSVTEQVYNLFQKSIPEETRNMLINGKLAGEEWADGKKVQDGEPIEVHGYTSNTDTKERNFNLSLERAKTVLAAFKTVGVPAGAFSPPQPHGEWETRDDKDMEPTDDKKKEKESPDWRKVVVKIKHGMTFSN